VRSRSALAAGLVSVVLMVTAASPAGAAASRADVFENLSLRVALPRYEQLGASTTKLSDAVTTLCASPTAANLDAARAAWQTAWRDWNRVRVFRFGPGIMAPRVSFPAAPQKIAVVIAGGAKQIGPPFTPESVALAGADLRGLEAIEYLLFASTPQGDGCAFAAAAAELTARNALAMKSVWTDGIGSQPPLAQQLARPKESVQFPDSQAALDEIVNGMLKAASEGVAVLADAKLPPPEQRHQAIHLGSRVQDNLWGVAAAYSGSAGGGNGAGIGDLVAAMSPTTDARVRKALERAQAAVKDLPSSLDDAPPEQLQRAYLAVRAVTRRLDAEVAQQLGVTVNLSDADGDS
jgi:predicted lipoprotein